MVIEAVIETVFVYRKTVVECCCFERTEKDRWHFNNPGFRYISVSIRYSCNSGQISPTIFVWHSREIRQSENSVK